MHRIFYRERGATQHVIDKTAAVRVLVALAKVVPGGLCNTLPRVSNFRANRRQSRESLLCTELPDGVTVHCEPCSSWINTPSPAHPLTPSPVHPFTRLSAYPVYRHPSSCATRPNLAPPRHLPIRPVVPPLPSLAGVSEALASFATTNTVLRLFYRYLHI